MFACVGSPSAKSASRCVTTITERQAGERTAGFVQERLYAGVRLECLYRDDLAYGQLAQEIAKGELEDDEHFDSAPLDGWLSDI
jgi:hypothetical protein